MPSPRQPYQYEPISTPLTPQDEGGYRSVMGRATPPPVYQAQAAATATPWVELEPAWDWQDEPEPEAAYYQPDTGWDEAGWDFPEFSYSPTGTPHERMALVLMVVMGLIMAGVGSLWWSGWKIDTGGLNVTTAVSAPTTDQQPAAPTNQQTVETILASGQLSPAFAPEVLFWAPQIIAWANEWSLDPNLVATVMQIESCGDPQAVSVAGASGLFQVMPFHFEAGEDMFDPDTNAYRGMKYLALGLQQHNGDPNLAMAGYNGGHGTVPKGWDNWPNEMQRYYRWGSGIYGEVSAGNASSATLAQWLAAGGASLCRQAADRQVGLR